MKNNNIIRMTGQTENSEPYTTVDDVAKAAGRSHANAIRTFKRHYKEFLKWGKVTRMLMPTKSSKGGRPRYNYIINGAQAYYLASLFRNDLLKQRIATRVKELEQVQAGRRIQHEINKPTTDALKDAIHLNPYIDDRHGFINVFYLVYKKATGMNQSALIKLKNADSGSLPMKFSAEQNRLIGAVQRLAIGYLMMNYNYQQLKLVINSLDLSKIPLNSEDSIKRIDDN